ncbi:DUF1538 domain-containing protein [Candidatus Methylomicrobium oryzae]|jgi:hypothetical protein|uniref:DUF1538 domain-containing protein n=1 Tax=Candidatus Methylomicrobium oryzae TaxID=2802053 RepID=UPI001924F4EB|nr:DUF1538 domain-containing protein [Methylomicrobium sp. RS1]MBL1262713.1 DUF1538 domain-containing protein [Methylomicrobium sp. RS1]
MFKNRFIKYLLGSCRDLAPIFAVVLIFQNLVIKQPLPDLANLIEGSLFLIIGLTLFVQGLELSLFPLGEDMAYDFARKGSLFWLVLFAFSLGFCAAIAEPALIAAAQQAAHIASQGHIIDSGDAAKADYALGLRVTVALSVGFALIVGVLRIIRGWPVYVPVFIGYLCVAVITPFAPKEIIGIAYDAGGIATSSITVPLVTALGVGLATAIKGRNPLTDGFGMVVFASQTPIVFVLAYGMAV